MSSTTESNRLKNHKKTVDSEDGRRRRQETSLSLRKQKKHDQLLKRRNMAIEPKETETYSDTSPTDSSEIADIKTFVKLISNPPNEKDLLEGVQGIRKMLSVNSDPPVLDVIESNAIRPLIEALKQFSNHQIVFEAAWALTNIASSEWTSAVVQGGIIPVMVPLIMSGNPDVREQASWCLGNIAGDGPQYRDMVIEAGAVEPLLRNVQEPHSEQLLGNVTWALSNLCRGDLKPSQVAVREMLPAFKHLLHHAPKEVFVDALWALSYCSEGENERIEDVMKLDVHEHLVKLLQTKDTKVIIPALRTVGNFVTGTAEQTQMVVDAGIIKVCAELLDHSKRCIRKEACWLVSNVAAGTEAQIAAVINNRRVVRNIIQFSLNAEWEVRKEALYAIANIVCGGKQHQVGYMVQRGVMEAFCGVLDKAGDTRIIITAMEAIERLLKLDFEQGRNEHAVLLDESDGITLLENLQTHADDDVYELAVHILEQYFGEDEESENIAPVEHGDQFGFGLPSKKLFTSPEHPQHNFDFGGTSAVNSPRAMRF